MLLAAHQPGYLPSISLFQKMLLADIFVLAADYQYSTHGAINRTQIKTVNGPGWLTVPVLSRKRRGQLIRDVEINTASNWRSKHWKSLEVNYVYSAYFEQFRDELQRIYSRDWKYLLDVNLALFDFVRNTLGIATRLRLSSELGVGGRHCERLFNMMSALGCTGYLAGSELRGYLVPALFEDRGLTLRFLGKSQLCYYQQFGNFAPDLSVVDLLLNEGGGSRALMLSELQQAE